MRTTSQHPDNGHEANERVAHAKLLNRLAKENASGRVETVEEKPNETNDKRLTRKNRELESQIQELKKKITVLTEKLLVSQKPEEISSEILRTSFRLDCDVQREVLRGTIMHLACGVRTTFSDGLKSEGLAKFISTHLAESAPGVATAAPRKPQSNSVSVEQKSFLTSCEISELMGLKPDTTAQPAQFVSCHAGSFQVHAKLDLSHLVPAALPLTYEVSVFVKPLGHEKRELIGNSHATCNAAEVVPLRISAKPLPAGLYRLQAVLARQSKEGKYTPEVYAEGGLVKIV